VRKAFVGMFDVTIESWVTEGEWPNNVLVCVTHRFIYTENEVYAPSMTYRRAAMPAGRVLTEVRA
jgi:hypothetical protein